MKKILTADWEFSFFDINFQCNRSVELTEICIDLYFQGKRSFLNREPLAFAKDGSVDNDEKRGFFTDQAKGKRGFFADQAVGKRRFLGDQAVGV